MEDSRSIPASSHATAGEESGKPKGVPKRDLANKVNFLHFLHQPLFVVFRHSASNSTFSVPALPLPSRGEHLDCIWTKPEAISPSWQFLHLLVPDGDSLLRVESEAVQFTGRGGTFLLPETCQTANRRTSRRYQGARAGAQVVQNSIEFSGRLIDFHPKCFRVELTAGPGQTFQWLNSTQPLQLLLRTGGELVLAAQTRVARQTSGRHTRELVLHLLPQSCNRFDNRRYRNLRQNLVPPPTVRFDHPLSGQSVCRRAVDLSGSGVAVEEIESAAVLVPGLIIPHLELQFADQCRVHCRAQVVHTSAGKENGETVFRSGLAFLEMAPDDQLKIQSLLQQAANRSLYVSNPVNIEELFRFFFDTGFLYPEKYAHLSGGVEELRQVYRNLYSGPSPVSRHFTCIEKDEIQGHLGMIRLYNRSWLIHHHAARRSGSRKAGLAVLQLIGQAVKEAQALPSSRMDYLLAFFRPENKFPQKVFGGAARHYDDPASCSIDPFRYLLYQAGDAASDLPHPWRLEKTEAGDLEALSAHYAAASGGLLLKALELEPELAFVDEYSEDFARAGLTREKRHLYSLRQDGACRAVFLVNTSAIGLNLSDLLNSITVIAFDEQIPAGIMALCLDQLSGKISRQKRVPVLFSGSAEGSMPALPEKTYNLWALDCRNLDPYFEFYDRLFGLS